MLESKKRALQLSLPPTESEDKNGYAEYIQAKAKWSQEEIQRESAENEKINEQIKEIDEQIADNEKNKPVKPIPNNSFQPPAPLPQASLPPPPVDRNAEVARNAEQLANANNTLRSILGTNYGDYKNLDEAEKALEAARGIRGLPK